MRAQVGEALIKRILYISQRVLLMFIFSLVRFSVFSEELLKTLCERSMKTTKNFRGDLGQTESSGNPKRVLEMSDIFQKW